ncbi:hypothetical protein [Paraburkholderia bannensis]|uniref:hypothetical protein n=1 Tax=Paraburkholderia bannensis TaxID=765414 RepID=UPI002AC360B1|nr:hypothetical protein [Paraburkholderia bannensis]
MEIPHLTVDAVCHALTTTISAATQPVRFAGLKPALNISSCSSQHALQPKLRLTSKSEILGYSPKIEQVGCDDDPFGAKAADAKASARGDELLTVTMTISPNIKNALN